MSFRLVCVTAALVMLIGACKKGNEPPEFVLAGPTPDPLTHVERKTPYLFTVIRVLHSDPMNGGVDGLDVLVAEDSSGLRWTFTAPTALGIEERHVITVREVCYRSYENPAAQTSLERVKSGCSDVVTHYAKPFAENPAPIPPSPPATLGGADMPPVPVGPGSGSAAPDAGVDTQGKAP